MSTTITPTVHMAGHAMDRCGDRAVPAAAVVAIVSDKLNGKRKASDVAVLVYTFPERRVMADGSHGTQLWAIVRGDTVTTVFYRDATQAADRVKLQVDQVIR